MPEPVEPKNGDEEPDDAIESLVLGLGEGIEKADTFGDLVTTLRNNGFPEVAQRIEDLATKLENDIAEGKSLDNYKIVLIELRKKDSFLSKKFDLRGNNNLTFDLSHKLIDFIEQKLK